MPQRGFCWRRRFADKTNKSPFNDVEGGDLALCALPKEVAQADLCDTFVPARQCSSFSAVHEMIPVFVTLNSSLMYTFWNFLSGSVSNYREFPTFLPCFRQGLPRVSDWPGMISSGYPQTHNPQASAPQVLGFFWYKFHAQLCLSM